MGGWGARQPGSVSCTHTMIQMARNAPVSERDQPMPESGERRKKGSGTCTCRAESGLCGQPGVVLSLHTGHQHGRKSVAGSAVAAGRESWQGGERAAAGRDARAHLKPQISGAKQKDAGQRQDVDVGLVPAVKWGAGGVLLMQVTVVERKASAALMRGQQLTPHGSV